MAKLRVYGYHGTNRAAIEPLLQHHFVISRNPWDWLGDGFYLFQDAPERALVWARNRFGDEAAAIGAEIRMDNCLDLLDVRYVECLRTAFQSFKKELERIGKKLPPQEGKAHRLDRHVINYTVGILEDAGQTIQSVRGAFPEGEPIFPGSALTTDGHVQIAVRDVSVIERVWLEFPGSSENQNA